MAAVGAETPQMALVLILGLVMVKAVSQCAGVPAVRWRGERGAARTRYEAVSAQEAYRTDTGSSSYGLFHQDPDDTLRNKRSNYNNYKHLVELAPILHKKNKEGKPPLAIILAASDHFDKTRKSHTKSRRLNSRISNATDDTNNGESDETYDDKKPPNDESDRDTILLNIKPLHDMKQTVILSSDEQDRYGDSIDSSFERQAKLVNALAFLKKYSKYKLKKIKNESRENGKIIAENENQNEQQLSSVDDLNYYNKTLSSPEDAVELKYLRNSEQQTSKELNIPQNVKENLETVLESSPKDTTKESSNNTKDSLTRQENDFNWSYDPQIEEKKEIPISYDYEQPFEISKEDSEVSFRSFPRKVMKKLKKPIEHENTKNNNQEIVITEKKKKIDIVKNHKKSIKSKHKYYNPSRDIITEENSDEKDSLIQNKQEKYNAENIKNKLESDDRVEKYLPNNNNPDNVALPKDQGSTKLIDFEGATADLDVDKYPRSKYITEEILNNFKPAPYYFESNDQEQSIMLNNKTAKPKAESSLELEIFKNKKELYDPLIKEGNKLLDAIFNKSKPEKESMLVNKNSSVVHVSTEGDESPVLKYNLLTHLHDISEKENLLEENNKTSGSETTKTKTVPGLEFEKFKDEKQHYNPLIKEDNELHDVVPNKSKPEKQSNYVNENSLVVPVSTEDNETPDVKDFIVTLLHDMSNVGNMLDENNETDTINFRFLPDNKNHKKNQKEKSKESKNRSTQVKTKKSSKNNDESESSLTEKISKRPGKDGLSNNRVLQKTNNITASKQSEIARSEETESSSGGNGNVEQLTAVDEYPKVNGDSDPCCRKTKLTDKNSNHQNINKEELDNSKDTVIKTYNLSFLFAK